MSTKHKRFFWSTVVGTSVALGTLLLAVASIRKPKNANQANVGQLTLVRGPIQNVRFTVHEAGIYPSQLRVRNGIVGISIEDRTGKSAGLLIERKNGNQRIPIGQVSRLINHLRGRDSFNLTPGRYRVSDVTRSTSEAELIVEPK